MTNQTRPDYIRIMKTMRSESQTIVNITEAKAQLSAIIEQVVSEGKEVIIGKAGKPVVKVVRYEPSRKHRRLNCFAGQIEIAKDFDEWPDDIKTYLGMDPP